MLVLKLFHSVSVKAFSAGGGPVEPSPDKASGVKKVEGGKN